MEVNTFYVSFYRDGECITLCKGSEEFCNSVYKVLKRVFFILLPAGFMMKMDTCGFSIFDKDSCLFSVDVHDLPF